MNNLDELKVIRDKTFKVVDLRNQNKETRIVVGMATCGIVAGSRKVLSTITSEISLKEITNVEVTINGCIGVCEMQPIVEVYLAGDAKVTYVNVDSEKAKQIMDQHIVNGKVISEYLIENK